MTDFPRPNDRHERNSASEGAANVPGEEILIHDSLITPEQAQRVNENFQLEIHGGKHGTNIGTEEEPSFAEVTPLEYDEARAVVDSMEPGDVLFVEAVGHPVESESAAQKGRRSLGDLSLSPMISPALKKQAAEYRQQNAIDAAERAKDERRVGPWGYASEIAAAKGIRVVHTDLNAHETQQIEATLGIPISEAAFNPKINSLRERATANQIKDYALEHLDEGSAQSEEKRRLVVLIGRKHLSELSQLFDGFGINATTNQLKQTEIQPLMLGGEFSPTAWTEALKQVEQAMLEEQARLQANQDAPRDPHDQ